MRRNGSIGHPRKPSVILACGARLMMPGTPANVTGSTGEAETDMDIV